MVEDEDRMPNRVASAVQLGILETKIAGVERTANSIDEKIDTLIEAFTDFKVEQTQAFGRVDTRFATNDEWRRNHDISREKRDREIDAGIAKAARSGPSGEGINLTTKQAAAGTAGLGILGAVLSRIWDWFISNGLNPPPPPPAH